MTAEEAKGAGPGRPLTLGEPLEHLRVRVRASTLRAIEDYAEKEGATVSEVVRRALEMEFKAR